MKHEDLLDMTRNPIFDLAKNYIVEGLSVRLDSYENALKKDLLINIEPRVNYELNESEIKNNQSTLYGNDKKDKETKKDFKDLF